METVADRSRDDARNVFPSGTVTFLFTDIEGSTQRWERDAAAMQAALRRHDELLQDAIAARGGHVFKTIGDAFCAVFSRAEDALEATLDAQRRLAGEDFSGVDGIRVRMALHSGTTDERNGDYFGTAVNRVARLLAIAHGGQIVLSQIAADLARSRLPPETTLRDLGEHRLKDITAPERVYQLLAPDLPHDFPALRSGSVRDNNLPQQLTSFIGRERDVAEVKALLQAHRLVTLFAAGGVGKTRCALQVGAELLESHDDGVWFADLAVLRDPALVASAIASLFCVQEAVGRPMLDTLVTYLRGKKLLLILDNCEHLIDEASKTAAAILRVCPHVDILATSREALKIQGEAVFGMPSLALPERSSTLTAADARRYGAVALFEARGRAVDQRFAITDENAATVAEICRRLDGIPLAIELAAARVKMLAPRQLAARLDERFRILTGGDRTALPRQQTMRALIDWSYDLLSEREQTLFRYVSIFVGGFTLETAIALCTSEPIEAFDVFDIEVLDLLSSLVDKSLVLAEPVGEDTRYRFAESTREYAHEKLTRTGEHEKLAAVHARICTDLAERLARDYETMPYRTWLDRTETEVENVRAALMWSFGADGDRRFGQRLGATLNRVFVAFAVAEARRWVDTALRESPPDTPPVYIARLELAGAHLDSVLNQYRAALASAERALESFARLGDVRGVADARRFAGRSLVYLGRVADGEKLLQESLAAHQALGSRLIGGTLRDLAVARALEGETCAARELFARALATFKESGDEGNVAVTAGILAEAEFRCGDAAAALRSCEDGLAAARALKRERMTAWLLTNGAAFCVALERYDVARRFAAEAVRLARDVRAEAYIAYAFQHLAAVAALEANGGNDSWPARRRALKLLGYVDARLERLEAVREYTEQQEYDKMLDVLRASFAPVECEALLQEGRMWSEDRASEEVLQV